MNIPILGIVQNMSVYHCTNCGHKEHIFGQDGVKRVCNELSIPLLANIPLHTSISDNIDSGKPIVVKDSSSTQAQAFHQLATRISSMIDI
jgi:ATP-binding protein involved in chromosome partitioning